jgi:hypothetical protein
MNEGSFSRVIEAHLELQRRNSRLERSMPIARYRESLEPAAADPDADQAPSAALDDPRGEAAGLATPWDDPDSWWNVRDEPDAITFDWRS